MSHKRQIKNILDNQEIIYWEIWVLIKNKKNIIELAMCGIKFNKKFNLILFIIKYFPKTGSFKIGVIF